MPLKFRNLNTLLCKLYVFKNLYTKNYDLLIF